MRGAGEEKKGRERRPILIKFPKEKDIVFCLFLLFCFVLFCFVSFFLLLLSCCWRLSKKAGKKKK